MSIIRIIKKSLSILEDWIDIIKLESEKRYLDLLEEYEKKYPNEEIDKEKLKKLKKELEHD